jgi:hypothetical protein
MADLLRVPGELRIYGRDMPPSSEIVVSVRVQDGVGTVELSILTSGQTEWVIELEPAAAAYLAGGLAHGAGVKLG